MKKVLFVATVVKTHIMEFHIPYLKMFKENGWETAVAARNDYENPEDCVIPYCDNYYNIEFERSPVNAGNIKSYKSLKKLIEDGKFDIIHCHTPIGGILTRIAAQSARKKGSRVIYTAHGFHFFKGAPLLYWLLYYPAEWLCSFMTDTLVTINAEDYELAKKHMHAKSIEYVPGVGVKIERVRKKYTSEERARIRAELGCGEKDVLLLSVGEVNANKNHELVIRALAKMERGNIHYAIAGRGELLEHHRELIKALGLENSVHLLGYCNDVERWYAAADIFVFPSLREGLSVALMEAMSVGLPCIASKIRGNVDLMADSEFLFEPTDMRVLIELIEKAISTDMQREIKNNLSVIKKYSIEAVTDEMKKIYFGNQPVQ